MEEFSVKDYVYRSKYNSEVNKKGGCVLLSIIVVLLTWRIPVVLILNIFTTNSFENLTRRDLNYWDVFWSGDVIRANAELQDTNH